MFILIYLFVLDDSLTSLRFTITTKTEEPAKCCEPLQKLRVRLGGSGVRLYDGPDLKLFILVGWGRSFLSVAWPTGVQLVFFFCSGVSRLFGAKGSPSSGSLLNL